MEYQSIERPPRPRFAPAVPRPMARPRPASGRPLVTSAGWAAYRWWLWAAPLLFIYVFSPSSTHLPFGFAKIVVAGAWLVILVKYRADLFNLIRQPIMMWGIFGLLLSLACIVFLGLEQPQRFRFPYRVALLLFEVFPVSYVAARFINDRHRDPLEAGLLLLYVMGLVQGAAAIGLFLVPEVNTMLQQNFLGFQPEDKIFSVAHRGFGIGSGYLFTLPLFQGLAVCCAIHLGVLYRRRWWLILGIPVIFAAIALNARIGFAIPILYLAVMTVGVFYRGDSSVLARLSALLIGSALVMGATYVLLKLGDSDHVTIAPVIEWVGVGFLEVAQRDLFYGRSTVDALLSMIVIPTNPFIGTGIYIFQNPLAPVESDIGYIIHLYYGGLFLVTILYAGVGAFFLFGWRLAGSWYTQLLVATLALSFAVANLKGDIITSNDLVRASFLILTVVIVVHFHRIRHPRNVPHPPRQVHGFTGR